MTPTTTPIAVSIVAQVAQETDWRPIWVNGIFQLMTTFLGTGLGAWLGFIIGMKAKSREIELQNKMGTMRSAAIKLSYVTRLKSLINSILLITGESIENKEMTFNDHRNNGRRIRTELQINPIEQDKYRDINLPVEFCSQLGLAKISIDSLISISNEGGQESLLKSRYLATNSQVKEMGGRLLTEINRLEAQYRDELN